MAQTHLHIPFSSLGIDRVDVATDISDVWQRDLAMIRSDIGVIQPPLPTTVVARQCRQDMF
jgi:hypothetical protein